jgi:hypothetical protein
MSRVKGESRLLILRMYRVKRPFRKDPYCKDPALQGPRAVYKASGAVLLLLTSGQFRITSPFGSGSVFPAMAVACVQSSVPAGCQNVRSWFACTTSMQEIILF